MKTLYLIRHAKSSWRKAELEDHDRPLKPKGVKDAYKMSSRLKERHILPDIMVSSPANRAIHTAIIFARQLDYPVHRIKINDQLYAKDKEGLLHIILNTDNKYESLMLFSHNPALINLGNYFFDHQIEKLPTSSILKIEFGTNEWSKIMACEREIKEFDYPKKKENSA